MFDKTFVVHASHPSDKWSLSFAAVRVRGDGDGFFAVLDGFGCGHTASSVSRAVRNLLEANGCENIVIQDTLPFNLAAHAHLIASGFSWDREPENFWDDGDAESGPSLQGWQKHDYYEFEDSANDKIIHVAIFEDGTAEYEEAEAAYFRGPE